MSAGQQQARRAAATGPRARGSLWTDEVRASASDLLASIVGGPSERGLVPGRPGHLVVLCHGDLVVAAGTHRWDAEMALQARGPDADEGLTVEAHRAWIAKLTEASIAVEGPRAAVQGILAALGLVDDDEASLPLGPCAAGALRRRGLLAPRELAPPPWGLSFDPELAGPIDLDPTEAP